MFTKEYVEKLFTFRKWSPEEVEEYSFLREECKEIALLVLDKVPECPERTLAIRSLHEAVYFINTAVTLHPKEP